MDQANYADALVFLALHSDFTVFAVSAFFLWRKGETFSGMIFCFIYHYIIYFLSGYELTDFTYS